MRHKKKSIMIFLLILFSASNLMLFLVPTAGQEETDKEFEGTLSCENEDIVTDSQWQWFKLMVDLGEEVEVTLEYSGDLDLDLFAYWGRDNEPADFNGYDLTHCPREDNNGEEIYTVAEYSQFRTEDTDDIDDPEEIVLENPSYKNEEDQDAYILVFVHDGEGESEYTITANEDMTKIAHNETYDCNFILVVLYTYLISAGVIFVLSIMLIKRRKKKILKQDEKQKPKVAEEKKDDFIDLNTQI